MRRKIIGYVSLKDPFHGRQTWSGSIFKIREALESSNFEVRWIPYGTHISGKLLTFFLEVWNHTIGRNCQWLVSVHFRPLVKIWAKEIEMNPVIHNVDFLFFPGGAQIAPYVTIMKPVIYFTDATAHLMMDYYWFNISKKSKKMAMELENAAAQNALINICSSKWAVNSMINDCHCNKEKCFVLAFGPNVDFKDIRTCRAYDGRKMTILFSGVDWSRKGGDIAVEVVENLRKKGVDAHLIVAGPRKCPKSCIGKEYIEFVGFLNKNNQKEYYRYLSLFEESNVFLLPTIAECSATVYSEAAAAGLPCYTYLTGGTGDYVLNGVNGYALPLGASADMFADQIINDIKLDYLSLLREGAIKLSREKLNWDVWSREFARIIESIETGKKSVA